MDFLNLAAQAVVLLAILIWTILKALWRLVLFVWQIARDYTPLMAKRVGKVMAVISYQLLVIRIKQQEKARHPEFDSGSKVRALFRKLQAAVSKLHIPSIKFQRGNDVVEPQLTTNNQQQTTNNRQPTTDTPSLSQSNPLLSLQSVPTAPVEDDLFSEAKVQSILALFGSASDSQSVETPADKDLEKSTEKSIELREAKAPNIVFQILLKVKNLIAKALGFSLYHLTTLNTSMFPFLDKISHRSAKAVGRFIKRLHHILKGAAYIVSKQTKRLFKYLKRTVHGLTKQSPNHLPRRQAGPTTQPPNNSLLSLIHRVSRILSKLALFVIHTLHSPPKADQPRAGIFHILLSIIHNLLSIIHISLFRGNKWIASTAVLLKIVISWLWQGLSLGIRTFFRSAQTLVFRLFHIGAKALAIITHPRLPSARERSRIISRVSFSGMVVSAVVLVFLFFPDFVFAVIPYQTEPIQSAVDKSALGGKFTDGNLYAPIHLPEQNEFLPDGNWLVISKTGVMTEIGEAPTEDHEEALKQGVWRVPEFADPTSSQNVPVILVAHKYGYITWSNKFRRQHSFYNLEQLEIGDTFEIIWDHRRFTYEIYAGEEGKEINDYKADVVLYTCKYLNSPARIFRYARRVEW